MCLRCRDRGNNTSSFYICQPTKNTFCGHCSDHVMRKQQHTCTFCCVMDPKLMHRCCPYLGKWLLRCPSSSSWSTWGKPLSCTRAWLVGFRRRLLIDSESQSWEELEGEAMYQVWAIDSNTIIIDLCRAERRNWFNTRINSRLVPKAIVEDQTDYIMKWL